MQGEEARARAAAHAAQVSAEALEMERVGVWLFKDRGTRLVCATQYTRSTRTHSSGQVLLASDYPIYVESLKQLRAIAAEDARSHPLTRELAKTYLEPAEIFSLLDAPIIRQGRVVGVVCHEHTGTPRAFGQKDVDFASSVADMLALFFEQADRLELEAALQEQAEERLEQQKMEALGRMARAVAHDFNNLLATITVTVSLLARSAPPSLKSVVDEVGSMIELGRRLTQQLMTFGKTREESPNATTDLPALVERMAPIVRTGLGKAIGLRLEIVIKHAIVPVDTSQLEQVLLNLCFNARDAIDGAGEITVRVREPQPTDEVAPDHVVLEVRDTGAGMNEVTSARVFEPFFTTKAAGTGLGLATVYGIVQRAGGVVRVTSAVGAGTTMRVALPRVPGS